MKTSIIILYLAAMLYGISWIAELVSYPSDIAVIAGILLLCLLLISIPLFRKLLKKIK